jgi:hypothetical protein
MMMKALIQSLLDNHHKFNKRPLKRMKVKLNWIIKLHQKKRKRVDFVKNI